ncbi:MAG: HlyD family efflux transporter periplasmic adaptor subunit [Victivallales bacterium]|nr:HlyD family efflux transporter periplasmic adaptor subunit [Victivallales bacterium]
MNRKVFLVLLLLVLIGGGWWFYRSRSAKKDTVSGGQVFAKVREGSLVINLTEAGSIKPAEQINIKSNVEGRNSIIYLVPEGQRVQKGDLLVELDSSTHKDNLVNQEITVQNAQASHVQAQENLEVVRNQAKADVDKAELTLRFAKEDLVKYKEGEYPKNLNELESNVTLATEELQRAKDKLVWSKKLFDQKYLSETEYRSDALSERRCELSLATARGNLALLKNYTYKRQVAQLESDVSQAEMALERTRRSARANVVQAEATLRARELELNRQNSKLAKIKDQIEKATITAPADGLVIYATSNRGPFRGNTEPLQEGQEVYERQDLIALPTADTFIAEIKVHETNLKKIYIGLPVRIRVDALPGQIFTGKIQKIAPLPDAQSTFMNPDLKLYNTVVSVEGGAGVLKSGMTCEAEIIVEQYEKAMYVPVQCVVQVSGQPVAYVRTANGVERREVEIGLDNNRRVRIISGLKVGEEVLITPPLDTSVSVRANEKMIDVKIPTRSQSEAAENAKQDEARRRGNNNAQEGAQGEEQQRQRPQMDPERMKQFQERLEKMSPEEREAFMKRMQERRQRRNQNGEGGQRRNQNGEGGQREGGQRRNQNGEGGQRPQRPQE